MIPSNKMPDSIFNFHTDEFGNTEPTEGMVNIDNYNPKLRITEQVGGATWIYGFNGPKHSSAYQHLTKKTFSYRQKW